MCRAGAHQINSLDAKNGYGPMGSSSLAVSVISIVMNKKDGMEAKYRISEKDYVNANKLFGKLTPKITLTYLIASLLLIISAVFGPPILKGGAIGGLAGGLIVTLVAKFIASPLIAKRHYRKYKAIHDEFTVQLLDDGVNFISSTGEGKVGWDSILKWRHNEGYILIYPMPKLYHIVPKSISESGFDIQLFIERLTNNVGKNS